MKIASRATPEGLAGHGLSTTAIMGHDTKKVETTELESSLWFADAHFRLRKAMSPMLQ